MQLRSFFKRVLVAANIRTRRLRNRYQESVQRKWLQLQPLRTDVLGYVDELRLSDIWANVPPTEWADLEQRFGMFPRSSLLGGGVNVGDRRAIYALVRYLQPQNVLEVGTYVGSSTLAIVEALRKSYRDQTFPGQLTTVDIIDVNGPSGPWRQLEMSQPPKTMMETLGVANYVKFIVKPSLLFLTSTQAKYNLIFLDGDHSETAVYWEILAAIKLLNPNGYILLHDYFPNNLPLWNTRKVVSGPWKAVQKLTMEYPELNIIPFGSLPWSTKLNSTVTSLALLGRKQI